MESTDRFFEVKQRLLQFAEKSEELLAVIAIGSSVRSYEAADEYSDLDLILVCRNPEEWNGGLCTVVPLSMVCKKNLSRRILDS